MASLIIDAVQAVGVASATLVNVELTDLRGDPVVGYVSTSNEVIVLPTTVTTDINGQVTIDLIPNADIVPGNTCYTVRIAEKQFLIQKSAAPQNLLDALVSDPGELTPIETNDLQDHINDAFNAHFASAIGFQPYQTLLSTDTQAAIEELYDQSIQGLNDASEIDFAPTGDIGATNVQDAIVEVDGELHAHLTDASDAHDASAISVVPFGTIGAIDVQGALEEIMDEIVTTAADTTFVPTGDIVATNVQDAIVEVDAELHTHETDATDAHDASAISFTPGSGISATDAQAAIVEARTDAFAYTDEHIADTVDAHDASAISFVPVNVLDNTNVQSALEELGESFSTPKTPSGFPNTTDTTIAVVDSGANLTFTLAPVGASFDVWLFGDKHTKTTETVLLPDGLDRVYYIYYDSAGTLSQTTNVSQPLGFDWATQVPVAIVFRNSTAQDLVLFDTRHGLSMDWATRGYLHTTRGTQVNTGLVLSGYTLSPGSPVDADNTWAMSAGSIINEDLTYSIPAVPDDGPYTTLYKQGTGSFSTATSFGTSVPFAVVGSDIAYNLNTAGSYSLAAVPNGEFVNYLIFVTGSVTTGYTTFAFPEETTYASLAAATGASITSPFAQGGFAFSEFFMRYRVTYQRSNAYTSTGRCRTVAVTQITNSQTLISAGSTPTSHGALTGREVAAQHPATAITFSPTGTIAATDVQTAIAEVASESATTFVPKDGSNAATSTSVVKSRVTADANPRWEVLTDGTNQWGNGTAVADVNLYRGGTDQLKTDDDLYVAGGNVGIGIAPSSAAALTLPTGTTSAEGILFDGDTNLYRSAANVLKTDDSFDAAVALRVGSGVAGTTAANGITFGSGSDVNLYRSAADTLRTDDILLSLPSINSASTVVGANFYTTQTGSGSVVGFDCKALANSGGTTGLARGFIAGVTQASATGTITTGAAVYASGPTITAGGAVTSARGVWILTQAVTGVTNAHGIYQEGGSDLNYFNGNVGLGTASPTSALTFGEAKNIQVGTTTGTKIGTATTQKLAFFNSSPVVQPSTTGETVGFTAGAGTNVTDQSTFTGNVGATAYRLSDIVKHLKNLGLIAV